MFYYWNNCYYLTVVRFPSSVLTLTHVRHESSTLTYIRNHNLPEFNDEVQSLFIFLIKSRHSVHISYRSRWYLLHDTTSSFTDPTSWAKCLILIYFSTTRKENILLSMRQINSLLPLRLARAARSRVVFMDDVRGRKSSSSSSSEPSSAVTLDADRTE